MMSFPKDWEIEKLCSLGSLSKGAGIRKNEITQEGIPCIRYGELYTKYHIQIKSINTYIPQNIASTSTRIFNGDILFAGSGETIEDIGKHAVYLSDDECYAGGDIIIFTPKKDTVDPLCLSYVLDTSYIKKQKRYMGQGQTIVHIYPTSLASLLIPLPPLEEQKRIAALLGAQDRQIEALSALIALRQRQFRGLVQALISTPAKTGRWNMVELGEIIKTVTPKIKIQSKDYLISGKYPIIDQSMNIIAGYTNNPAGLCSNPPYIIFGDHTCVTKYIDYPFVQGADGIKIFQSKIPINIKYLYFSIIGNPVIPEGYKRHFSILSQKSIPLPSAEEQERIASILGAAQRLIACLERKRELCLRRKKGLMQVLLTGKVRV